MKLKLTWKDNATTETEQRIYVSTNISGVDRVLVKTVASDVEETEFDLPAEFVGKQFYVTVAAYDGKKESTTESFYVAKDGQFIDSDFHSRFVELNKKHAVVKPTVTAVRSLLDGDTDFLTQSAICGELANGKILNYYYSKVWLYDPLTLQREEFTSSVGSGYMQTKGVVDYLGQFWGIFQRSAEPEAVCFDGTTEQIPFKLKPEESGSYVGFNMPDGKVIFLDISYGVVKAVFIDPVAKTYTFHKKEGLSFEGGILGPYGNRVMTSDGVLCIADIYRGSGEGDDLTKLNIHHFDLNSLDDITYSKKEFVGEYNISGTSANFGGGELFGFVGQRYDAVNDILYRGMFVYRSKSGVLDLVNYDDFTPSAPGAMTQHGEWCVPCSGSPTGGCVDLVDPIAKTVRRLQLGGNSPEWSFNVMLRTSKGIFIHNGTVVYRFNFQLNEVDVNDTQLRSDVCQGRGR